MSMSQADVSQVFVLGEFAELSYSGLAWSRQPGQSWPSFF